MQNILYKNTFNSIINYKYMLYKDIKYLVSLVVLFQLNYTVTAFNFKDKIYVTYNCTFLINLMNINIKNNYININLDF